MMTAVAAEASAILQRPRPWRHEGLFMGMHWLWWLFWIVTILVLVWAVWRGVVERRSSRRRARERASAEEELRTRFARGELGEEEFKRKMDTLREYRRRGSA